ncbi:sulfurtransferase TusA family protein [Photobacterium piscicola]|uniref:Sulfurtransferase TusA family protein n=1 Tax=Photobacterium piscicola TaxID=1378299 RepID=A0ABU6LMH3_9GAMM|nr:sulfurtransferase TusA family protein [Photobacterium piscicola]MEC6884153.1 sulfurtransferase TusA family protein [Photobacterium piscicola]MEC6900550.1 sulfurtransferase TusA family protein [Photobacterium piscicola]
MDNHCHAIGMEILTLDLMAHRCPLALLMVKRACCDLLSTQKLEIKVLADGTQMDIIRYLTNNGFILDIQAENTYQLVIIVKKGL